ncbi:MAG: hydrogenase maturation nickel metallochaperone HypA [Chitinophagaceae bacterium]|nr:hydrogenase maturation nickel metallochaperone HypA [Chitinophagaceae bacterium]MBL0335467.1 hydrogenase maturation nickel metallochaperone HypA [Chitinophagaceae bacterium]
MHELSLVMSILQIAEREAEKHDAKQIEEIELEIGELSGVDRPAFDFAWEQAIRSTKLEKAQRHIHDISGEARCLECDKEFAIHQLFDPCPHCGNHFVEIRKGKEFRVKSLVVS